MVLYDARRLTTPLHALNLCTRAPVTCLHFQHSASRAQAASPAKRHAAPAAMPNTQQQKQQLHPTPDEVLVLLLQCRRSLLYIRRCMHLLRPGWILRMGLRVLNTGLPSPGKPATLRSGAPVQGQHPCTGAEA